MKILSSLLITLIFVFTALGQVKYQEPTCGTPEINRIKALYRKATPQVKANAWLFHLSIVRADGKRTPEQIAAIDEVLPLISADLFDKRQNRQLPRDVIDEAAAGCEVISQETRPVRLAISTID